MAPQDKEYAVNWKSHMNHMKEAFESLFDNSEFVDVTLYCEGRKIGAHKMVLSACSPYFRDIFKDVPCQHHVIVLNNVDFTIMEHIVRFIYHGEVSVHNTRLNSFLQTAQMLKISGLMDAKALKVAAEYHAAVASGPSETVTKRKRNASDDDVAASAGGPEQQVVKLPRQDVVAPVESEEIGLMDVKDVKCEPEDLAIDPLADPLQHGSSLNDLLQESQFLTENEELESETMDDAIVEEVPDETEAMSSTARDLLLPSKSKHIYEEAYSAYSKWRSKNNIETTTEDNLLSYFGNDLAHYASSSLWSKYSMLRSTINLRENVDISKYSNLITFLKRKGEGHKPKKSLTLTKKQINDFLTLADNREHLLNKVILIFGVAGACRCQELVSLSTTCVEDSRSHFLIKLVDTESKKDRSFIVAPGDLSNFNLLEIIREYMALRPGKTPHNRFFVNYAREKCTVQPVGIHRVGSVPTVVAKFLKLDNPTAYTGHCFRRTSASLVANRPYSTYLQIG